MKTQRRHELHTNILSTWVERQLEAIQPYLRSIAGVLVGLAVILAAYVYLSHRSASSQAAAWDQTLLALNTNNTNILDKMIEQHGTDAAGLWARLLAGEQERIEGVRLSFSDKVSGQLSLNKALDNFQVVVKNAHDPDERQQAMFGLARTYESLDKLPEARAAYEAQLKEFPNGQFAEIAAGRAKDLDRDSTKAFYDWFAKQDPVKPSPNPPSSFTMPDLGDLKPRGPSSEPPPTDIKLPGEVNKGTTPAEKPAGDKQPTDLPPTVEAATPEAKPKIDPLKPTEPGLEAKEPNGGNPPAKDDGRGDASKQPSK